MPSDTFVMNLREWLHRRPVHADILALIAGASLVLAFAPFSWRFMVVVSPAILMFLWRNCSPRRAFRRGYLFGLSFFGVGISWVFNSIYEFGNAPVILALAITLAFILFLSLYPALAGALIARFEDAPELIRLVLVFPCGWVLTEWLRSWVITGFPWLLLGQAHLDTPLSGVVPVFGVLGASWLSVTTSGLVVLMLTGRSKLRWLSLVAIVCVWGGSYWLGKVPWVEPAGSPFKVSLLQGNISQDAKWRPENRLATLNLYRDLTRKHLTSDLIVWPESAVPMYYQQLERTFFLPLLEETRAKQTQLVVGVLYYDTSSDRAYNSLVKLGDPVEFYHKRHLVPFGEYMPLRGLLAWMDGFLDIPMSDLGAGRGSPVLRLGELVAGVSICYEDAYGNEVIDALPAANFLINVSNDAWFGDSLAPHQHLEIASLRALETGRFLLRATNTGISAVINEHGETLSRSPQFKTHVLTDTVIPMQGTTPFAYWGNWAIVTLLVASLLIIAAGVQMRNRRRARATGTDRFYSSE